MYSTLYRVFSAPTNFTEANHQYRGIDGQVHATDGSFTYYTDFRYACARSAMGDYMSDVSGEVVWRMQALEAPCCSFVRVRR